MQEKEKEKEKKSASEASTRNTKGGYKYIHHSISCFQCKRKGGKTVSGHPSNSTWTFMKYMQCSLFQKLSG